MTFSTRFTPSEKPLKHHVTRVRKGDHVLSPSFEKYFTSGQVVFDKRPLMHYCEANPDINLDNPVENDSEQQLALRALVEAFRPHAGEMGILSIQYMGDRKVMFEVDLRGSGISSTYFKHHETTGKVLLDADEFERYGSMFPVYGVDFDLSEGILTLGDTDPVDEKLPESSKYKPIPVSSLMQLKHHTI